MIAAAAGRASLEGDGERLFVADYLPGGAASARAALVVCNGGSPTTTQALLAGTPVLGLCSNMDQFLNMQAVDRAGAGLGLRADRVSWQAFERVVGKLAEPRYRRAAEALAASGRAHEPVRVLQDVIEGLLGARSAKVETGFATGTRSDV